MAATTVVVMDDSDADCSSGIVHEGIDIIDENEYEVIVSVPANLQIIDAPLGGSDINTFVRLPPPAQEETNLVVQPQAKDIVVVNEHEMAKQQKNNIRMGPGNLKPMKYGLNSTYTLQLPKIIAISVQKH